MLMTAMTTQMSAIRTTWAVLTELVLAIRDARNDPRSTTALGATPPVGQACSVTAVAPMPSPTEPRPMTAFAHMARPGWRAGWMPCCASLVSTCLLISELILSTSPSATASSYVRPSSVCAAAAAATSCCARSSMQRRYIASERLAMDPPGRSFSGASAKIKLDANPGADERTHARVAPVDGCPPSTSKAGVQYRRPGTFVPTCPAALRVRHRTPVPRHQWVAILHGVLEVEVTDGSRRTFGPGDLIRATVHVSTRSLRIVSIERRGGWKQCGVP